MNEDKLDRWGDTAGLDQAFNRYSPSMQAIQEEFQKESLRRLDERLNKKERASGGNVGAVESFG